MSVPELDSKTFDFAFLIKLQFDFFPILVLHIIQMPWFIMEIDVWVSTPCQTSFSLYIYKCKSPLEEYRPRPQYISNIN